MTNNEEKKLRKSYIYIYYHIFDYIMCTVYYYVYINTHICMYLFKNNVTFIYLIYYEYYINIYT